MFRFCAVAALLLSVAPLRAADPAPADDSASVPWYKRVFSRPKPKPVPVPETVAEKPPTWQDVSRSVEQEKAVWMERMEFCTQLRIIAFKMNDLELAKKADDLEAMAEQVYTKRMQKLPSIVKEVRSAEASLDDRRNSEPVAGWAETGRGAPASTGSTITNRAPNGRPARDQN